MAEVTAEDVAIATWVLSDILAEVREIKEILDDGEEEEEPQDEG